MTIGDFVRGVVGDVLSDMLRKTGGTRRRRRRRAKTPTERLREIEKLLKPVAAKRQVSRRRTVRARAKAKQRV